MRYHYFILLVFLPIFGQTQTNILVTNPEAHQILKGNYDAANYLPSVVINHPDDIIDGLIAAVSADTLKQYLIELSSFENRNTGSDTISNTFGMGAARRWAYAKFQSYSAANENRLLPAYLQFDQEVCGMGQHRNVFAVLPGVGPQKEEVILVEGHMDSRCEDGCDINCTAHGMEDNGSGTVLVLELARIMSQYTFNRSIVFMVTTGEEQGLVGANAFATFAVNEDIKINAVFNNDIVGGIMCGETASPPGCPSLNHIDSINVRVYSSGGTNSRNKNLARFSKLEYQENVWPIVPVQTVINIMSAEDRSGRGGDHIPFREKGFAAIRFTSANEHGNGNPSAPDYHDRQHTMSDLLGVDTNGDEVLDSFFVDFNYLARNAVINGNAMAMAALGPIAPPDFDAEGINGGFHFEIADPNNYGNYRIGIRNFNTHDWDTLYSFTSNIDTLRGLEPGLYLLTACTVDSNGIESLFSKEIFDNFSTGTAVIDLSDKGITLLQNRPNPFDEATTIGVKVDKVINYQKAEILVHNLNGKELARYPISLQPGINEIVYDYQHHRYEPGMYAYSLYIDDIFFASKTMVYAY